MINGNNAFFFCFVLLVCCYGIKIELNIINITFLLFDLFLGKKERKKVERIELNILGNMVDGRRRGKKKKKKTGYYEWDSVIGIFNLFLFWKGVY